MGSSYKEAKTKFKDLRNIGTTEDSEIKNLKKSNKIDKPFILEIVHNGTWSLLNGKFNHGKYHTLSQAKQALEGLKKSQCWMQKYTKEYNIYHIDDKSNILVNYTF